MALEGLRLGNYRLVRLIGNGGMGEIYQAEDMRIQRQVAIKIIRNEVAPYPDADATKEAARLFQREMQAITTLDYTHILPLFEFGEENINRTTFTYMIMPLRQEGSLADWLQDRGSTDLLSPEDVAHVVNTETSTVEPLLPGTMPATPWPGSQATRQASIAWLPNAKALLIGLVVLLVLGSVGIFYLNPHKPLAQIANPYPSNNGRLALNDPLHDNSSNSYPWYEGSDTTGACTFTGGAYRASASQHGNYYLCTPGPSFSEFTYEVQMTVLQGDGGGIVFRADAVNFKFYRFLINQSGSYALYRNKDNISGDATTLTAGSLTVGSSPSIHTGLNQPNLIAVVANGSNITLYVNHRQIAQVSDGTYSQGQIGVFAEDEGQQTEVVFSNAKVWAL